MVLILVTYATLQDFVMSPDSKTPPINGVVITQAMLREAQALESFGLSAWKKVWVGYISEHLQVEPGELKMAQPWIPGKPMVVSTSEEIDKQARLREAMDTLERYLAVLRAEQRSLVAPEKIDIPIHKRWRNQISACAAALFLSFGRMFGSA